YRVVNAADSVPSLPPTWFWEILIGLAWALPIPYVRRALLGLAQQFRGYRHHGDMRYLTACDEELETLRVVSNPSLVDRAVSIVRRLATDIKAGFRDHAIAIYCGKLEAFAVQRLEPAESDRPQRRSPAEQPERAGARAIGALRSERGAPSRE
ncbi:MAG: hypothetical protein ACRDGR_07965, partial [bacterium]